MKRALVLLAACSSSHPAAPTTKVEAVAPDRMCVTHGVMQGTEVNDLDAWIERAQRDFAASRKANPEPNARRAIAEACHKGTDSIAAAHERCNAGPRPKVD